MAVLLDGLRIPNFGWLLYVQPVANSFAACAILRLTGLREMGMTVVSEFLKRNMCPVLAAVAAGLSATAAGVSAHGHFSSETVVVGEIIEVEKVQAACAGTLGSLAERVNFWSSMPGVRATDFPDFASEVEDWLVNLTELREQVTAAVDHGVGQLIEVAQVSSDIQRCVGDLNLADETPAEELHVALWGPEMGWDSSVAGYWLPSFPRN